MSSTLLQDAFVEYFNTNRARPPINENQIQTPPLQLVFRHDCMYGSGLASPLSCVGGLVANVRKHPADLPCRPSRYGLDMTSGTLCSVTLL